MSGFCSLLQKGQEPQVLMITGQHKNIFEC